MRLLNFKKEVIFMIDYFFIEFSYFGDVDNEVYNTLCIEDKNSEVIKDAIKYTDQLLTEDIKEKVYAKITFFDQDYKCLDFYFLSLDKANLVINKYKDYC